MTTEEDRERAGKFVHFLDGGCRHRGPMAPFPRGIWYELLPGDTQNSFSTQCMELTMKSLTIAACMSAFVILNALGQGQAGNKNPAQIQTHSSSRVKNGDILDSVKYYIRIAPVDTILDQDMPRYKPGEASFVRVDVQPVPITQVQPTYPVEARGSGIEGRVWVNCLIGKDGKVKKANVVRSDSSIFNKPAISAALQWRFTPATIKGKPVEVWANISFRFTPDGKK